MKRLPRLEEVEKRLSGRMGRVAFDALALAFFFMIILMPTIYLLTYVLTSWDEIRFFVFENPVAGDARWRRMLGAIGLSFQIAAIATALDLLIGIPIALLLARYDFKGRHLLDSLIDIPLGVPSSALGFSVYLFWATGDGLGWLSMGFWLIVLTHVAFTFPYIVRSLVGVIESVDITYEHASRTLGAPSFTTFRTITAPLAKPGIVAGAILAFTRSLSETGATMVVAGTLETAPLAVVSMHQRRLIGPAAFLSLILVLTGLLMLVALRVLSERVGIPIKKVWPEFERRLSGQAQRLARDTGTLSFFGFFILLPACFTIPYVVKWWSPPGRAEEGVFYQVFQAPDEKWRALVEALMTSFRAALLATLVNLVAGLAMAILIVRRDWGRLNSVLDALTDVPLVVPTAALGFSVYLFWGPAGLGLVNTGFWLIVLTHVAFTYPYVVRTLVAALRGLDPSLEEAARTLGAPPLTAFRTVILPLLSSALFASSIMAFTRSLSETGATIVVMGVDRTVPVQIVVWSEASPQAAAFASVLLIAICYSLLLALRYVVRKRR